MCAQATQRHVACQGSNGPVVRHRQQRSCPLVAADNCPGNCRLWLFCAAIAARSNPHAPLGLTQQQRLLATARAASGASASAPAGPGRESDSTPPAPVHAPGLAEQRRAASRLPGSLPARTPTRFHRPGAKGSATRRGGVQALPTLRRHPFAQQTLPTAHASAGWFPATPAPARPTAECRIASADQRLL
ncbi:hypothetical protein D3C77_484900 [compost metagenome]